MSQQDRQPDADTAGFDRITPTANDRLGCAFSALYSFWLARQAAIDRTARLRGARRDAYSLLFFDREASTCLENDFGSSPDELLTAALAYEAGAGTNFTSAIERVQYIMNSHWNTERYKIVLGKRVRNFYTMR
jgi:hypothetical protein